MVQGAQVLVVEGQHSRPQITPIPGAGFARSEYRFARADGPLVEIFLSTEDTGEAADERRLALAGSQDPRRVARWLQQQFPGAELVGEPKLRMVPGRDPAVVELEARVPRTALLGTGGIGTFPGQVGWISRLAPTGPRRGPLLLPVRPALEWSLEVDLGQAPRQTPADVSLDTPYGELEVDYEGTGTGYRVTGSFRITPQQVAAGEAEAVRQFLVAAERHLTRPLEVP
jgi:hypothetical protein